MLLLKINKKLKAIIVYNKLANIKLLFISTKLILNSGQNNKLLFNLPKTYYFQNKNNNNKNNNNIRLLLLKVNKKQKTIVIYGKLINTELLILI